MLYWGLPQTSDRKEAETNYDGHLGNNDTLSLLYNNQTNARAVIGQSAMVYCAGKLVKNSRVF